MQACWLKVSLGTSKTAVGALGGGGEDKFVF